MTIILLLANFHCRAGSSANNLAVLNFEYLAMCVRFGMQSIHDSNCPRPLRIPCIQHGSSSRCMMEESSADRNQCLAHLRAQRHKAQQHRDSPHRSQRLASQREREARCHEQESSKRRYASLPCYNCLHN